jgi:tight adherence protein B
VGNNHRKTYQKGRSVETAQAAESRLSHLREQAEGRAERRLSKRRTDDYSLYYFTWKEWAEYLCLYAMLDGCISYLFFSSFWAFLILLPGGWFFLGEVRSTLQKKRAKVMKAQFLDAIQMMSASLQAGYSAENALREALKELRKVYEPGDFIIREFERIEAQLGMSRSMEELLLDFGRRSAIEDIRSFAEVFLTAKRSGGDLLAIIRNTVSCIRQKQETMQEIETCLAGKVMEQNIMSLIPAGILAYVRLTSPDFLNVMYGNLTGVTVMILCFLVYLAAYFWGKNIMRIEV